MYINTCYSVSIIYIYLQNNICLNQHFMALAKDIYSLFA